MENKKEGRPVGEYPSNFDVPALRERRYLWGIRLVALIAISSIFGNVAMAFALFALTPLKEVRPFLVQFAKESEVVATIHTITSEIPGFVALTESLAKEYVVKRHAIVQSDVEMENRWAKGGFIHLASSEDVYNKFITQTIADFKIIRSMNVEREIKVTGVNRSPSSRRGVFLLHVNFEILERAENGDVLRKTSALATMEAHYQAQRIPAEYRLINPTGFVVTSYDYEIKTTPEKRAP